MGTLERSLRTKYFSVFIILLDFIFEMSSVFEKFKNSCDYFYY